MNDRSEIERVLVTWFDDGPTVMPDRVATVVADRIGRTRQRGRWRLERRLRDMNPFLKIGVAVAAVVLVAAIGFTLLPARQGIGVPAPSPAPSLSPAPTPTPSLLPDGDLAAGAYLDRPIENEPSFGMTFTVPDGWTGFPSNALIGPGGTTAPGGIGMAFLLANGIHSDPCHWDHLGNGDPNQPGDLAVGPTIDDLAVALRANTTYTTSPVTETTVGGYPARELTIQVPEDLDLATCDHGNAWLWGTPAGEAGIYVQGAGNRWHLRIVDVAGRRLIIAIDDYEATPADAQAQAQSIVDSIRFDPGPPAALPDGSLQGGRDYTGRALPGDLMAFTITAPAGWSGFGGFFLAGQRASTAPDGVAISFNHDPDVVTDPCDGSVHTPTPGSNGPSVDDLVAALSARDDLLVSGVTDVELAGYSGKRLDLQLPETSTCSSPYVFAEPKGLYSNGPGNRWRVWLLDVGGEVAVVVRLAYAGTPAEDLAAADAAIETIRITK